MSVDIEDGQSGFSTPDPQGVRRARENEQRIYDESWRTR